MSLINMMALRHSAFYTPYLMTMAGGFLKQAGLDYTYQVETPNNRVVDKIKSGECHLAQSAVAASFSYLQQGIEPPFKHFAQINQRDGFFLASKITSTAMTLTTPSTKSKSTDFVWEDLVGKTVLVDHFFQPLAMFKYALHLKGVDIKQINIIDAGDVSQIETTFRASKADFVHMQGPAPQQLEYEQQATVVASVGEVVGPVAFSSLCASPSWLKTQEAHQFLKVYQQSLSYVLSASAKDIAKQLQQANFFKEIESDVLSLTIQSYQNLGCWSNDIQISQSSYDNLLKVFKYSQVIDRDYLQQQVVYDVT